MKNYNLFFCLLIGVLLGCKKNDITPSESIKYNATVEVIKGIPGESATIRFSQAVKKSSLKGTMNTTDIEVYAINDSVYNFILPVVPAGEYDIKFQDISLLSKLNISIKPYPIVTQAQPVIDSFSTAFSNAIDSLTKLSNSAIAPIDKAIVPLFKQFQEEFNTAYASLTANEKLKLAYFLREHKIDYAGLTTKPISPIYYNAQLGGYSDPSEELIRLAKDYTTKVILAAGSVPFLIGSTAAFAAFPNPYTTVILIGSITTYVVLREAAIKRAEELGKLNGVVESITDIIPNDSRSIQQTIRSQQSDITNASTIPEFSAGIPKFLKMRVEYRNLIKTDIGLHENITGALKNDTDLEREDKRVADRFNQVKNALKKVNLNWVLYTSRIPNTAIKKVSYTVPASNIFIKSVSDNRLNYVASPADSGINVKLNSTVTENINFNMVVGFKSNLINKSFEKSLSAKYMGAVIDSTELYRLSAIGKYTVTQHVGNGPNSKLFCELKNNNEALYTIFDDPSWPNGYVFRQNWTVRKINNEYFITTSWTNPGHILSEAKKLTYPVTSFFYWNNYIK
ncbi:hypothetical protein [Sediminibacterium sp.]|uniref:hypothetical protein n=1 Tax=Sediminibacterium sp. TaxID=1917865 RepID=UPI003F6EC79E